MENKTFKEQAAELDRALKAFGNAIADEFFMPLIKLLSRLLAKVGIR